MTKEKENITSNNQTRLIIKGTGPHYEHISEFKDSFYKTIYKEAFLQLNDIINHFKKDDKNRKLRLGNGYYDNIIANADSNYERFSNIITFIGKRGSGKSSAMLSFMEALKHYYSCKKMTNNKLFYEFENIELPLFTCLDCIDGSLLEHGEDIFKIVLAQMYQKFIDLDKDNGIRKEGDFAYRKRELLLQLEGIYRTVCDIERMENKDISTDGSYISSLQSLSSSQKVKKDFKELIQKFTSIMKYERLGILEESNDHFVIITIDDIDLNISNGFSMLEKIHRYCMVQNVIVLLSVDIEQMLSIVSKNFYKVLPKVDKLLRDGADQVYRLSTDYLNKVMPVNYRLYLPEISNYSSSHSVFVGTEDLSIKETILTGLYKKIGIYFDSRGIKQHFYEPKSMRELSCFYLMLEAMKPVELHDIYFYSQINKNADSLVSLWEENYMLLTADLRYRIAIEKLYIDKEVYHLCEILEKEDIRRAKDEIVNFYNEKKQVDSLAGCNCKYRCKRCENRPENSYNIDNNIGNYSYGQLIEAIYNLGRIEEGRYKPLVHYLLGYLSYAFTRLYIYEKFEMEFNGNKIEKGTFKSLVGANIIDNWSRLIMPSSLDLRNESIDEPFPTGNDTSNRAFEYFANFKDVTLTNILDFSLKTIDNASKNFTNIAKLIRNVELRVLLFSNIREDGQNGIIKSDYIAWTFDIDSSLDGSFHLSFKPQIDGISNISLVGDFSILNFIVNSMDAVYLLNKVEQNLIECLAKKYNLYTKKKQLDKNFEKALKQYSLKTKYENWEKKFGKSSVPLPIYWVDFTYNILKRTKRIMSNEFLISKKSDDAFLCIQKVLESIKKQLGDQQSFYKNDYRLMERFTKCPVVEYFLESTDNSQTENDDKKEFNKEMMKNIKRFTNY